MTNTLSNVGHAKTFLTLGVRNFEDSGTVQYASRRRSLWFQGTVYNVGGSIPFDVASTSYSRAAIAQLRFYWEQGFLTPLT